MNFILRFDLRNPAMAGVGPHERVRAAVEMARWADETGALQVMVLEHHGSDDGYLPTPMIVAAAMSSVTERVRIAVTVVAPFYDPLRLAEDLAVLDALSEGRLDVTLAAGYARHEFEMFGIPSSERPQRMEEAVAVLRQAWTGEPFDFRDRTVRVTPTPHTPGGPALVMGGSSEAAARRAARIADGFLPVVHDAWGAYRDELVRLGRPDPGDRPEVDGRTVVVAEDPAAAWDELEPYFLHETNAYAKWLEDSGVPGPFTSMSADELRAADHYWVVTPEELVESLRDRGPAGFVVLHPMAGGTPPELSWRSLELFEKRVLPAVRS